MLIWKQWKKIILIMFAGMALNSCATKEYTKQESVFITFKTPTFKYADLGFMYRNSEEMKVEIYGSGQALMSLEISKKSVCMSLLECMSKASFNQQVLSASYPESILENIFKGSEIFGGEGLVKTRNGFTQNISKQNKYNINYSVLNNEITFHDTINDIIIKVKGMGS